MKFVVRADECDAPHAPGDRLELRAPLGQTREYDGDYIVTSVGAVDSDGWQELDLMPWPRGPGGRA